MKYKAILFDMDGTVLNTLDDLADATNVALQKNGCPLRTTDEVRQFVGNGIRKLIERAVPAGTADEKMEQVYTDFTAYYSAHCADRTRPYEKIPELLARLRAEGYRTAVVSNKADGAVQALCRTYFDGLFDAVAGEKPGVRRKPAPDTVYAVLLALGLDASETVYIGDSDVDLETARNAGMQFIGVSWGFRGETFLREKGAGTVVSDADALYRAIADGVC